MIPKFAFQWRNTTAVVQSSSGILTQFGYSLLLALWNRTGGATGIPFTVGSSLTAAGGSQATALPLIDDYNEVLNGVGGVSLYALSPGQSQTVYNGTAAAINVYPAAGGQINGSAVNAAYSLAAGASQQFVCYELLTGSGAPLYRPNYQIVTVVPPSPIKASLAGNVTLNNTGAFFDGPTIAQGTVGTWFVSGSIVCEDTAGSANFNVILWDGTTVIDSAVITSAGGSGFFATTGLSGIIAGPADNLRISAEDRTSTNGLIIANNSGNGKDSTISAFRIA